MGRETKFHPGQEVYLSDGQACEFVGGVAGEYVVRPSLYDEYEEPCFGSPRVVAAVFAKPPVAKLEAECAVLTAQLVEARRELSEIQKARLDEEREISARKKRLAEHDKLARVDDFINGRITHVVDTAGDEVRVRTFADAFDYKNDYGRKDGMKLLWLFGRPEGPFYGLNTYKDGSGSNCEIIPCRSEEEAAEEARRIVHFRFEQYLSDADKSDYRIDAALRSAAALGVPIPPALAEKRERSRLASLANREQELTKLLVDARHEASCARERLAAIAKAEPHPTVENGGE